MPLLKKPTGTCATCRTIPCQCSGSICGGCGKPKFTQCVCAGPYATAHTIVVTGHTVHTSAPMPHQVCTCNNYPCTCGASIPPIDLFKKEKPSGMKPSEYFDFACLCMQNNLTLLVIGMPGGGKTEITIQAADHLKRDLIITHPVIDDPTNYKGFPFKEVDKNGNMRADFVPFGMLRRIMEATRPTTLFMDDMGQAPKATQAAAMQLLWGGTLNGKNISPHVSFVVATNRREDKAAVTGMIEPLKNRATIVNLETNVDDWCKWAINDGQPPENVAFNRFRRDYILNGYHPTMDFTNSATPRTIAKCGTLFKLGIPKKLEREIYEGTAGKKFATDFTSFLVHYRRIPNIQNIIKNPDKADIPDTDSILYATCECLAVQADQSNFDNIITYGKRLHEEFYMMLVRDSVAHNSDVCKTTSFIQWQAKHQDILLFTGNAP
jgi:hypothetical protein